MPDAVTRPVRAPGPRPADRRPKRQTIGVPVAVAMAVLLVAEIAVRLGASHLTTPSAWPAPELQKKYDQIVSRAGSGRHTDVVLTGDSMMDAAGDPAGLTADGSNASVYNASIAGETLPTIIEWTTKVVVPRLHPRLVVVGLSSNELNPDVLLPAQGLAAYDGSRAVRAAEGKGGLVDRADAFFRHWSYLYRYRSDLRHPFTKSAPTGVFDPLLTSGGQDLAFSGQQYLQSGGAKQARVVIAGTIAALTGFTVGPANVSLLQGMLTSLRHQGIQVMLVAMPVTDDLVSFHPRGAADYQLALSAFTSIAHNAGALLAVPGVWPTSEFADPVHLNGVGTARFSTYLAPRLRQAVGTGAAPAP